jgi:hypothetical protein
MSRCHIESRRGYTQCQSAICKVSAFVGALRQVPMDQYDSQTSGQQAEPPQKQKTTTSYEGVPFTYHWGFRELPENGLATTNQVNHQGTWS